MSSQDETVAGRYAVGELLGEGAFAFTYRARDIRLGRDVALKILRPIYAQDPGSSARFTREAIALASVSHRNVVQVYDQGRYDGTLFIAMEYLAGQTLRQARLDRGGRLAPDHAVDVILQVLRGLQAVHRAGIIHRDIKPENILIGHDGIARVVDFGISTDPTGGSLTMTGTTLGTAAYMAPEQARGDALTAAADIYSVGVVLFELLTGRLPFRQENAVAMMLAHQQAMPPSPRQSAPDIDIPARLDAIVLTSLAKHPGGRFPNALAMERALTTGMTLRQSTLEQTAKIRARPIAKPLPGRTPVRTELPPPQRAGSKWPIALLLLAIVIGTAIGAAVWSGWDPDRSSAPTSTPRLLEAVPDETDETQEEASTEPAIQQPELTEAAEPTSSAPPIVLVSTETPAPRGELPATVESRPTVRAIASSTPTASAEIGPTLTPAPDGQSPSIEPSS